MGQTIRSGPMPRCAFRSQKKLHGWLFTLNRMMQWTNKQSQLLSWNNNSFGWFSVEIYSLFSHSAGSVGINVLFLCTLDCWELTRTLFAQHNFILSPNNTFGDGILRGGIWTFVYNILDIINKTNHKYPIPLSVTLINIIFWNISKMEYFVIIHHNPSIL